MKKTHLFFALVLFSISSGFAQLSFKTGDVDFDVNLKDMNVKAKADLPFFKKEISLSYNIAEGKIDQLMIGKGMEPADVFMAAEVAKKTAKPFDEVVKSYEVNKDKGWGVIAKEMGIKPGSPEFHALKDSAKGKNEKMKDKNKGKGKGKGKDKGKGKKK